MKIERYIDEFESNMLNFPTALVVKYRGVIDKPKLEHAFAILCSRHPILCAHIRSDLKGTLLVASLGDCPEVLTYDSGLHDRLLEVGRRWDVEDRLAQLVLLLGEAGGYLALFTDHAIADGASKSALFGELWAIYVDLVDGTKVLSGSVNQLPAAPSTIIQRYLAVNPTSDLVASTLRQEAERREASRVYIQLSRSETANLLAIAKSARLSVHGLVSGVILCAQRAQLGGDGEPVLMTCSSPVDIRNHLKPKVAPTDTTNLAYPLTLHISLSASQDPVGVGREVMQQLTSSIEEEAPQRALAAFFSNVRPHAESNSGIVDHDLTAAIVSNLGAIPRFPQTARFEILDFQLYTHVWHGTTAVVYVIYSYAGRLSIQSVYHPSSCSNQRMGELMHRIGESLCCAGFSSSSVLCVGEEEGGSTLNCM